MPKRGIGMSYFHFSQTQSPFIAAIGDKAVLMDTNSFSVINSKYFLPMLQSGIRFYLSLHLQTLNR